MQNNDAFRTAVSSISANKPQGKPKAKEADAEKRSKSNIPDGQYTDEWLTAELKEAGIEVYYTETKQKITYHYVRCPNEAEHTVETKRSDSKVFIYNGWPVFKCHHGHCAEWKWPDYAEAVGIEWKKQTGQTPGNGSHYFSDFYEWKEYADGTCKPTKVIDVKICNWICENYIFFIMGKQPYFLTDTNKYELDDDGARMKRLIQSCIVPSLCKDSTIKSIYNMILYQDKGKKYEDLNQYPVEYVPFLNGFYDPVEKHMLPILPEHYLINQIPHEYDPAAAIETPIFDNLLQFQLPDPDARELWLEYGGTCFNRDTGPQKFMTVTGPGATGKSVQLNTLVDCIGAENVSHETLQGLTERFNATQLFGKLANICADISSEDLKQTDVLKKITGQDRGGVKHELKGKDAFFFSPFCKLLFSANEIPLNRDEKSNAFYRRLLITVMDRKPEKIDRALPRKLQAEIPGIIHRYMEALERFYDRGGHYQESGKSDQEVRRMQRQADSVIAFLDDKLQEDLHGRAERGRLYIAYETYCEAEGRLYPVTRNRFFERLRSMGYGETKTNGGQRFFTGLSWRTTEDQGFVATDDLDPEDGEQIEIPFEA